MEESNKSRNDQGGNKKMVIKMGGGGGGIGAVVLLGGALATAAFASAFVLGQKRRSSEEYRRQKSEKGQEIIPRDHEHIRKEEKEEVAVEKDSTITISADEVEPTKVEEIPSLAEGEKLESIKEEISEPMIRADVEGVGNVNIEEKNETGNGEMNEEKCVEPERAIMDLIVDEIVFSEKTAIYGCIVHAQVTKHVEEEKTSMQFDAKQNAEEDQISPEEVEVVKYVANVAAPMNLESEEEVVVHENGEVSRKDGDDEESNEVMEAKSLVHTSAETNRVKMIMDHGGDKGGLCSEENSKWEAQWQGEWPKVSSKETKKANGMSYEVGGKIQEDYSATFTNKEVVVMRKERPTRWRVVIWTLSVLSSLSCSWFFDLSSAKLCLVVFLTVFMLEIYGYPLLDRKQAQCLQAAKGERIYGQRSLKK